MIELYPVLPFLLAAIAAPLMPRTWRRVLPLVASLAALIQLYQLPDGATLSLELVGHDWILMQVDALGRVFSLAFVIYTFIVGVYGWSNKSGSFAATTLLQGAGGTGIALVGDLFSLYIFWEMLTVSSLFLIWEGRTRKALSAGFHYVILHLLGGICLLAGGVMIYAEGPVAFDQMDLTSMGLPSVLILIGLVTNAALPPLHAWLPDAYPAATFYGTCVLAAFTTKSAICVLIRLFPGSEILMWGGAAMALYGVVFAVLENDIRRLLSYHIISQVGYMICGVGLGTAMALNGSAVHAFSHIFYKGLLLMSAGAVIYATGRGKLTELGGLARPLMWVLVFMMIGGFSISGVPLFNGFVSKSMIVYASGQSHRGAIELMLEIASMGTFLHTGLKLPWFTFFGKDNGARVERPVPISMYWAMGLVSAICIGTGIFPELIYQLLPYTVDVPYNPFTGYHIVGMLQLLVGTALGFWLLRGKLGGEPTVTLDVDRLYRGPVCWVVNSVGTALQAGGSLVDGVQQSLSSTLGRWAESYKSATHRLRLAHQAGIFIGILVITLLALISYGT